LNAALNDGSCGNGASGWMYVKKSSTSNSRIEKGQMDSALRTACEENEASVAATLFGLDADDVLKAATGESPSSRRRLMASACRFGGPRRREGRSNVHGMSRATQARHGGPASSHCSSGQPSFAVLMDSQALSLDNRVTLTLTFLTLHESQALRRRFPFCASVCASVCAGLPCGG
jgi:hypothetical protein